MCVGHSRVEYSNNLRVLKLSDEDKQDLLQLKSNKILKQYQGNYKITNGVGKWIEGGLKHIRDDKQKKVLIKLATIESLDLLTTKQLQRFCKI